MIISMIAAMTPDRVIGINNSLPWKLPADMKWFRQNTMGKPIIMGRKTFESFGAKPLPGRQNIIISRDQNYQAIGCDVVHSIGEAIALVESTEEVMIIGGATFYEQMLPLAQRLYLTYVDANVAGDAWFPEFDLKDWKQMNCIDNQADEKNSYDYHFVVYERI